MRKVFIGFILLCLLFASCSTHGNASWEAEINPIDKMEVNV